MPVLQLPHLESIRLYLNAMGCLVIDELYNFATLNHSCFVILSVSLQKFLVTKWMHDIRYEYRKTFLREQTTSDLPY